MVFCIRKCLQSKSNTVGMLDDSVHYNSSLKEEPCMKKGCYRVRTEKSTLTIQLEE